MKADGSDAVAKLEGNNNQVQQRQQQKQRDPLTEWVAKNQRAIQALLPEHMDLKRFARMTLQAILENPRILACHPDTIVKSIMDAAKAGLEIDGRRSCIVPYKGR